MRGNEKPTTNTTEVGTRHCPAERIRRGRDVYVLVVRILWRTTVAENRWRDYVKEKNKSMNKYNNSCLSGSRNKSVYTLYTYLCMASQ